MYVEFQEIQQHQAEFVAMLNDPEPPSGGSGGGSGGGLPAGQPAGGGGGGGGNPMEGGYIQVTPEEKSAIERVGFSLTIRSSAVWLCEGHNYRIIPCTV